MVNRKSTGKSVTKLNDHVFNWKEGGVTIEYNDDKGRRGKSNMFPS